MMETYVNVRAIICLPDGNLSRNVGRVLMLDSTGW